MVRKNIENRTVKVSEGCNEIEELTIRTETKKRVLNIITLYGKTERAGKEKNCRPVLSSRRNHKNIEGLGEEYILIGDLNSKIGNKEDGINGNNEGKNEAGKALLDLEQKVKGIIVNRTQKCKGKWTRINTQNEKEKSILDYVMTREPI
ncbi:unnamed protein product [Meganyctiphanes norvegica]|uniref:Craniofacial development protein 2-like n=1 Tax=Meganyctiphanes norvegica TaxID=48144 RepID=A0AAV2S2U1_MEGNR